jgi:hypothetical protein
VALRQQAQPQVLRDVGVLVLVHQDVRNFDWKSASRSFVLLEDRDVVEQQVAEIHGVQHFRRAWYARST